ncbi:MAG TPA: hypothetical protein VNP96_13190, partial [Solirubrobacterales bacterium]|nr:hypothetical protein [Solirubrobacterales bacterium]
MHGTVNPAGQQTSYQFEYGTTTSYGSNIPTTPQGIGSGSQDVEVSEEVEGLQPGTTYHFRVAATSSSGTTHGQDKAFRTDMGGELVAGEYPAMIKGGPDPWGPNDLTLGSTIDCLPGLFEAEALSPIASLLANGGDGTCYTAQLGAQPFEFAGCKITFDSGEELEEGVFGGALSIGPAGCGPITTKWPWCGTATIDLNGGYVAQIEYTNVGEGASARVLASVVLSGLDYTRQNNCGSGTNGTWEADWELWGENELAEEVGLWAENVSPLEPKATTKPATELTPTGATLNARVNPRDSATSYQFEYAHGNSSTFYLKAPASPKSIGSGGESLAVSEEIDELLSGGTYSYRISATNAEGTTYGKRETFVTPDQKPTVTTEAASDTSESGATLKGTVNPNGYATTYQFEYGKTASLGSKVPAQAASAGGGSVGVKVEVPLAGLQANTVYHYRLVATNTLGTSHGKTKTFTTVDMRPVLSAESVTERAEAGATLNATINPNGAATSYQFEYGETTVYGSKAPIEAEAIGSGTTNVAVDEPIEGLDPETIYHFRIVATNSWGTTYGKDWIFATSTSEFSADEYPATIKGEGIEQSDGLILGLGLSCSPPPFATETLMEASTLPASPSGDGQCWSGQLYQPLDLNDCKVTFGPGEQISQGAFAGTLALGPEGCGPITVKWWGCGTAAIDPGEGFTAPAEYTNVGQGSNAQVIVSAEASELEYTKASNCSSGSDGHWRPKWELSAENELEEPIGLRVTDVSPAPNTVINTGPSGKTLPNPSFTFMATETGSTFECSLDGAPFSTCTSPKSYQGLAEGQHEFRVRATDTDEDQDPTPAVRNIQVYDPPETTITSPTPSYTSHDKSPIEFTSDETGSTFKCSLDGPEFPTTPCTSPYSLPEDLDPGWHTFRVVATDSAGNKDPISARWTFNQDIYPPAPATSKLVYPEEGKTTASYYTLKAEWGTAPEGGGVTAVTFQMRLPYWDVFKDVPAECVIDGEGEQVSWPLEASGNPGHTEPVFLGVRDCKPFVDAKYPEEKIKFRALFDGGKQAAGASEPATTEFSHKKGGTRVPTDAIESIGPVSLDLLTGAYTISRTDVSIPVPGSSASLEFTRVYNSSAVPEGSHGPMGAWQMSTPAELDYEGGAWTKVEERVIPATLAVYGEECWEEEGEEECEKWLAEEAQPEERWMELVANGGEAIPFEIQGESYVSPDYAKELKLTREDATHIVLADADGTHTTFLKDEDGRYLPKAVSFQATPTSARMVYEDTESNYVGLLLKRMIAPSPPGVTCGDWTSIEQAGCRTLNFEYLPEDEWAVYSNPYSWEVALASIRYYNATGANSEEVAKYNYDGHLRLIEAWDPRLPNLKEKYAYHEG